MLGKGASASETLASVRGRTGALKAPEAPSFLNHSSPLYPRHNPMLNPAPSPNSRTKKLF